ncbi:exonuclease domain-containing protein [Agarivorans sp. Alg241-V36]|uniref:exonuclease domain-containing protein n=1 Tax=Agarivorans sp. Alg241-V36 TaxID=2305992 RepID=UPI0013D1A450|nr:exonuclease domain-containing protein [Agarivorans sp. Alg241-V36]
MLKRFKPLAKLANQRSKALAKTTLPKDLALLLSAELPKENTLINDLEFLAFDIETTGLDPSTDQILSIGFVTMKNLRINMQGAEHYFVNSGTKVKAETAVINQIVPEMLEQGISLDAAMDKLFNAMHNKALLVHGRCVEQQFIEAYIAQRYQDSNFPMLWIDTLSIEKSLLANVNRQKTGDYRLASVRKRYGLPDYPGHNALVDAVATAELLLAQSKRVYAQTPQVISALVKN